jgi:hypothetical protein
VNAEQKIFEDIQTGGGRTGQVSRKHRVNRAAVKVEFSEIFKQQVIEYCAECAKIST